MGPRLKVSSERPEKQGIDLTIPALVVWRDIHYTTAASNWFKIFAINRLTWTLVRGYMSALLHITTLKLVFHKIITNFSSGTRLNSLQLCDIFTIKIT